MSDEIKIIFRKLDEVKHEAGKLNTRVAIVENTIESQERQFSAMNTLIATNHGKLDTKLNEIGFSVKTLSNDYHQRVGAKNLIIRWAIPILALIASMAAIYYSQM